MTRRENEMLPVLGAASRLEDIAQNQAWFLNAPRDIEIGGAVLPDLLDQPDRQPEYAARLREQLAGHTGRIGIHGPFQGFLINPPDPFFQRAVAQRFIQSVRFAASFGASWMVIHSPFQGWTNPFIPQGAGSNLAGMIEHIRATLAPVLEVCGELNVQLVMENIRDLNIFAIIETVRAIDHPMLRISLDTGHAHQHVKLGGMTPDQYIREAGDLLAHIHLQDSDGEADRHWAPGYGTIPWYGIFSALRETGAQPRLILELKDKSTIQQGAAYLSSLGLAR